jgi:ribonucleoside-diphosphate reductase alpha chain
MRSLSLAARGGFAARTLQDMRKVSWDRGQVRLGDVERMDGHRSPRWHDSEVAALAYAIQQILYRRGFLDAEGNQLQSREIGRKRGVAVQTSIVEDDVQDGTEEDTAVNGLSRMHGLKCPTCGANAVIRKDGCDFCTACGEIGACG